MAEKAQNSPAYWHLPIFMRQLREEAELSQRGLGKLLKKPQSWIYNCETGARRIDITEFILWCKACNVEPNIGFRRLLTLFEKNSQA